MEKQWTLILPAHRPTLCKDCPMFGDIPKGDYEEGSKWTHRCFLPGDGRQLTGRGAITPTARNRCKVQKYQEVFLKYQGRVVLSQKVCEYYGLHNRLDLLQGEPIKDNINKRRKR